MASTAARSFKPEQPDTEVSFYSRLRGSDRAEPWITARAQKKHFGEATAGWQFVVMVGRGDYEGMLLRLVPEGQDAPKEAGQATLSMKGSARLIVTAWELLGMETMKGKPCKVLDFSKQRLLILLPDWCEPKKRKARFKRDLATAKP